MKVAISCIGQSLETDCDVDTPNLHLLVRG